MKKLFALTAAIMLLCMVGGPAFAGWTVVNLHPSGATWSCVDGISGGQQVGEAYSGGAEHASLWSGTAASWVDLTPAGAWESEAFGVLSGRQVGEADFGNSWHAILWSGTAASWVDLHPLGATYSEAFGISGGQQVGYAEFDGNEHAGLWSGTAASWVDLHPAPATSSEALGVSGGQQVGGAVIGESPHAGLWSGTAESWVDLHPAGATESYVIRVSGGRQVGTASFGGYLHAGLWNGTAASWFDLHALLPAGVYSESEAWSVDVSAGETWVGGYATSASTGEEEAMLWHFAPAPAIGIRACDLRNQVVPPNPVRTWGRVTTSSPLRISDGRAEIELTGLSDLDIGDYLWVEGDWNGSVLAASQDTQKAKVYKFPSRTELVYIPAGSFLMGTPVGYAGSHGEEEHPEHSVDLSGYWIGKYEVTRGEYRRFIEDGGYSNPLYWSSAGWTWRIANSRTQPVYWSAQQNWGSPPGMFTQTDNHPVVGATWYEAEAYCNWARTRLPTEAEWEKAARWDGHPRVYSWGDVWDREKCNNRNDTLYVGAQTSPVGSYPIGVSPYGLHDTLGNVWEWVHDWYQWDYYANTPPQGWVDPSGPASGSYRVLRGNSWFYGTGHTCAERFFWSPTSYYFDYGFRMAR